MLSFFKQGDKGRHKNNQHVLERGNKYKRLKQGGAVECFKEHLNNLELKYKKNSSILDSKENSFSNLSLHSEMLRYLI